MTTVQAVWTYSLNGEVREAHCKTENIDLSPVIMPAATLRLLQDGSIDCDVR
jgi:hypothetical protein